MRQVRTFKKLLLVTAISSGFLLAGCDGDDGEDGKAGADVLGEGEQVEFCAKSAMVSPFGLF